jgi:hypothetical protein
MLAQIRVSPPPRREEGRGRASAHRRSEFGGHSTNEPESSCCRFGGLAKLWGAEGSMTDMQKHLEKIRTDAAECRVLSNLATDGKRELFTRLAEHLNDLALEVEKSIATNGADVAYAADHKQAAATDHAQAARSRWMLPWLLVIVLVTIAGAFLWANNRAEKDLSSVATLQSKPETSPAPQDDTKLAIAALISGEQGERKVLTEQLSALAARIDNLERALDNLQRARAEIAGPRNKQSVGAEERPTAAQTKPSAPEEMPVRAEEKCTSATEKPAAAEGNVDAKQSDSVRSGAGKPNNEPVDRVGAIPVPKRAELDPRKPAIGAPGCTHFRSFDPVSGTYTSFDGRRRECR